MLERQQERKKRQSHEAAKRLSFDASPLRIARLGRSTELDKTASIN